MGRSETGAIAQNETGDVLVYDVADLRRILGIGRPLAYKLAKRLGRQLGRRFVVARTVLEAWVANARGDGARAAKPPGKRAPERGRTNTRSAK